MVLVTFGIPRTAFQQLLDCYLQISLDNTILRNCALEQSSSNWVDVTLGSTDKDLEGET